MDDELSNDEVSPHVKAQIDQGLKRVFEKLADEELPDRLKDLIAQLYEKSSSEKGDDE